MIPVLVAALLAAAAPSDTVFTADGGRVTGTVLEESPTSGVTIQTPDGAVRRIDRDQIQRIEFADGTVSTVKPAAPAAPAAAAAAAAPTPAAAAPAGPMDSAYFKGGGRVRDTVMEESASTGVKIRLLDGSIRTYAADEFTRIEYADGTVSTPHAPPAPAPAPRAKTAEPAQAPVDNVFFLGGGRVRGTVIEESPKTGVKVRLLDGTIQTYSREDLVRIEYADGSVSRRVVQPTPAPVVPPPMPQPAAAPSPPAPALKTEKPHAFPLYLAAGVGVSFLSGNSEPGVPMSTWAETEQAHLSGELGLRFSPSIALGVYGDVGVGDPTSTYRDQCQAQGFDCTAETTRWGLMVRHTWNPLSRRPTWLSLGTGWETGGVVVDNTSGSGNGNRTELFTYKGREYLRVGAGVDFRSNDIIGLGLYGTVSVGEYDHFKDVNGVTSSIERASHTTAQIGLRLTLFP